MTGLFLCIILSISAYLLGSIPFGLVLTRCFTKVDIQKAGSGNIGATNVFRTTHKSLALLTLIFDILKGFIPVIVGQHLIDASVTAETLYLSIIGLSAFLGHLFPLYLRFKGGGKGVATAGGFIAALSPLVVGIATLIFILVFCMTSRVSAASITASLFIPILFSIIVSSSIYIVTGIITALFIVIRHKKNIIQLIKGEEATIRW